MDLKLRSLQTVQSPDECKGRVCPRHFYPFIYKLSARIFKGRQYGPTKNYHGVMPILSLPSVFMFLCRGHQGV
jgi:hypothetical protein